MPANALRSITQANKQPFSTAQSTSSDHINAFVDFHLSTSLLPSTSSLVPRIRCPLRSIEQSTFQPIKMKTTIFSTFFFLAAALATPIRRSEFDIEITLFNDATGKSAVGFVPTTVQPISIAGIFNNKNDLNEEDAVLKANRVALTDLISPKGHIQCLLIVNNRARHLSSEISSTELGFNAPDLIVPLTQAKIVCNVDGENLSSS
ncbi:hypothetical protein M011DRAFT_462858 [Sporormia fimetaria CBS 119925]|uniref:Uncharacterized protein n=1 Tax=Sporormia fimetaria CBS 119925 TaxID=1340428 RepID=A0A6A6UUB2_9PLEO|nr:hypothetical protein M011DRAFT_462858 [Sporormia fimetaria CBS 119925]